MSIAHALSAPTILADAFNEHLQGSSPLRIVVLTVLAVHCWRCLSLLARLGWHDSADAARQLFFWYLRRYLGRFLPLERALTATRKSFARDFAKKQRAIPTHFAALPRQGIPKTELLASCTALRGINSDYSKGQASGCVYHGGADGYTELINEAMALHQWTNPLHAGQFAGVRRMEIEVIAMVVGMFHGDDDACGALTSGGTESILLAMKAYRDMAFDQRCVSQPEIVLPETAHAAFFKAADYFKIRARKARVDPETCKVDMAHLRSLITSNTVALVASAPQYPHGIVDPIEQIAALGVKHGIPVHVDACLGGFLLPFMRAAGFDLGEGFDFRVAGVTSISCDTHKYGFAPKGSSVILYRSRDIRKYQMHAVPDWPGGIYASPIISGSRPGNIVAGTWAALLHHGESGFVESTKQIVKAARFVKEACGSIAGISVMGDPLVSVVAFTSKEFDIYRLLLQMEKKGWELNSLQFPPALHLCVTMLHAKNDMEHAKRFVDDLTMETAKLLETKDEKATGMAALYGTTQSIPDRSAIGDVAKLYFDAYYDAADPGEDDVQSS